jgi:hypothetical protein
MSFITDFIYYNSIGATLSIGFFLICEYVSEPDNFLKNTYNHLKTIEYWTYDKIISFYTLYRDYIPNNSSEDKNTIRLKDVLFSYNENDKIKEFEFREFKKCYYYIDKENELYSKNKLEENDIQENMFLGINLTIGDTTWENIKHSLDRFMVKGFILNKHFMKEFMKVEYCVNDLENYEMHLIDRNCVPLVINQDDELIIGEDKFSYSKVESMSESSTEESIPEPKPEENEIIIEDSENFEKTNNDE